MAEKVVFFTAGPVPTSGELADIAKLNAVSVPQYETLVVNGASVTGDEYGTGRLIPCDAVAGTIPTDYNAIDEIDPDAIPNTALLSTQTIVAHGQALEVPVTGTYTDTATVSVVAGVVTGIVLS